MQKSKPNQKTQKAVPKAEAPKKDKLKKNQKPKFEEEEDEVEQEKHIDQVMEEDVEEDEKPQKPQRKANKGKKVVKEESEEEDEGDFDDDDDHGVYNVDLGDDDFYIPAKKAKVDNNKAKTTKKEKVDESKKEEEKSTANKSNKEKKSNSKADRLSKKNKDEEKAQRGILYVAHLPYGFVEEGIKEFFLQYGEILNIHLARSKKTARSMGFAFIEFKYKDVAKVAADAMNGYMFYGKKLVCRVIEDDQGMRVHTKKFKFIPFNKKFIEQKNAQKEPAQVRREVKSLLKLEERRRQKLKELNIDYDFPGFKAAIDQVKQQSEKGEN